MKIRIKIKKFLVAVSLLSILIQSTGFNFYALKALADDSSPTPTVSQDNPTPSDIPSPTPPQDSITPTPIDIPIPTDTITPTSTDVPADIPTPTQTQVDNLSPPEIQNDSSNPPIDGQSQSLNPSPVPTSIEASNTSSGNETLSAVILKDNPLSVDTLNLENTVSQQSASLTTDKEDYAPTDTAIITGTNFEKNQSYILAITSSDEPPVNFQTDIKTDENGGFLYAYQLDGNYRPNYKVEVKNDSGTVVASTTFTDTDTTTLFPNGQGNYNQWNGDEGDVDETGSVSCSSSDAIDSNNGGNRESVNIDLSSIPNGSTVTSVQVFTWDVAPSSTGGTYQTFVRVGSTNTDSGVNLATTSTSGCTARNQTVNIPDFVKSGSTDLEVGVLKVGNTNVRVGAIRAVVIYTAAPQPDLTATKTNNVSGNATVNQAFTWTIRVQNSGAATATFTNNEDILRDERPSTGVSSYESPTITTSGITGNVDCTQSGTNNRDLTCEADGIVTLPPGSYIDISFTVTPNATGTLSNPRSGQDCEADDDNNEVSESNENNNDCTDTVTVNVPNTPPSFDAIADQAVNENSSSQNIAITNVSPGPSGESGQTVTMSATSSDPTIVPNPSVSGSGSTRTLTYTPATNKFGSVTITVTADDGQSENNTYSRTFTITVIQDTTPPTDPSDVRSTSHVVDTPISDNTIDMAWSAAGEENGATDDNSGVDGYSYAFTTGAGDVPDVEKDAEEDATGMTSDPLGEFAWYFHLRTVDNEGNWSSTVTVGPFLIDTTDPETTIDSGPSGLVSVNDATFEFSSNEDATFECQLDGSGFSACTSPQTYNDLIDGEHTFNVQAKDSAGNTDPTPASQSWTVDATAPTLAEITSVPTPDNNSSPSYTFNSTEAGAITYGGDCSSSATAAAIIGDNTIAFDPLLDGLHNNCTIVVTDDAGNASETLNVSAFTIDTVAPVSTIDSPDNDTIHKDPIVVSGNSSDTNSDTVSYTRLFYKTSDCNEDEDDCWTEIDTNSEAEGTQPLANSNLDEPFNWSFTWTPPSDGTYDVKAEATDDAGNTETSPVVTGIIYDTTLPTTPIADPAAGDYTSDQSVTLSSSDSLSGLADIFYTTDGSTPDNSSTQYVDPITIGVDTTLKAIAYDNAGNPSNVLTAEYGIAPVISDETSGSVTDTSVTITWITDDLATSRVIYDTVSHLVLGTAPNYDYANSTVEADTAPKVISHSVDITGLTAGTTYYYRTVSHGSPEAVGDEKSFATTSPPVVAATTGGGDGGGDGKSDGLGCGSHDCSGNVVSAPQVLGALISPLATGFSPEVLGETTSEAQLSPAPTQGVLGEEGKSVEEKPLIQINKGFGWKKISASVFVIILIFFLFWFFRRRRAEK